jgi:hypothetical protein
MSLIRRRTVIAAAATTAAAAAIHPGTEEQKVSYVFTDEFNGRAGSPPDPSKWNHETGRWTDNNELQTYTDSTALRAHFRRLPAAGRPGR